MPLDLIGMEKRLEDSKHGFSYASFDSDIAMLNGSLDELNKNHLTSWLDATKTVDIAYLVYRCGRLCQLSGTQSINASVLSHLMICLTERSDLRSVDAERVLEGIYLLRNKKKIEGRLGSTLFDGLIKTLAFPEASDECIYYMLRHIAAHYKGIEGALSAHVLNELLFKLSNSRTESPQHIAEILECLGLLAQKNKITGFVWVPLLDALLFYSLTHPLLKADDISRSLQGILSLKNNKILDGYVDDLQILRLQQKFEVDEFNESDFNSILVALRQSKPSPKRTLMNDEPLLPRANKSTASVPLVQAQGSEKRRRPNLSVITGRFHEAIEGSLSETRARIHPPEQKISHFAQYGSRPGGTIDRAEFSSQTKRSLAWEQALHDRIFRAIANKNMVALESILQVNAPRHKFTPSPSFTGRFFHGVRNSQSQSTSPSNGFHAESNEQLRAKSLVESFLSTSRDALMQLIEQSEAKYFGLILRSCSFSTRYNFAKLGELHPIILKLCSVELGLFVCHVIALGMYRDHMSILNLVHALNIRLQRYAKTDEESHQIQALQQQLINRSISFHELSGHDRVVEILRAYEAPPRVNKANKKTSDIKKRLACAIERIPEDIDVSLGAQASIAPLFIESSFFMTNGQLNMRHLYTAEAINRLLLIHVGTPGLAHVRVLGALNMTSGAVDNSLSEALRGHFISHPLIEAEERTLLVPIHVNQHWVGVRLVMRLNESAVITFYDSLHSDERKHQLMQVIQPLIQDATSVPCIERHIPCLQQPDGVSCGPYLVENMLSDLTFFRYSSESINLPETLRRAHLEMFKTYDSDYYEQQQRLVGLTVDADMPRALLT